MSDPTKVTIMSGIIGDQYVELTMSIENCMQGCMELGHESDPYEWYTSAPNTAVRGLCPYFGMPCRDEDGYCTHGDCLMKK